MIKGILNIARFMWHLFREKEIANHFSSVINCNISSKTNIMGLHNLAYVIIDEYTYVAQNSNISYTKIGKYCSIGPNFLCGWGIHPTNGISTSPMFYSTRKQNGFSVCTHSKIEERKEIVIGNDVFIGANVTILDGVTIGNGAVIGAGAVVSKNIPPYAIAVGCPIKIIKYRFDKATIEQMEKINWWDKGSDIHTKVEADFFNIEHFLIDANGK